MGSDACRMSKLQAHGVSRGIRQMDERAPEGRKTRLNNLSLIRSFAHAGAGRLDHLDPRLTPWAII